MRCPGFALLLFAASLGCAAWPSYHAAAAFTVKADAQRRVRFLERAVGQLRQPEPGWEPSASRYAMGTLAAAELVDRGSPAATPDDIARWAQATLDGCAERWEKVECEASLMALQRLVIEHPAVVSGVSGFSPALRAAVREVAGESAPPPDAAAITQPWSFKETENQRLLKTARSLVAAVAAGTPDSPAARAWGAYAAAFLRAHQRDGWYEQESPGYLGLSIASLLQLADLAPQPAVRDLATRQLNGLFAAWAQEQVGGFPAGAKSRTYVHWALGERNTPWVAWAWLAGGIGQPGEIFFLDAVELAVARYRIPLPIRRLLAERRAQPPYAIRARRAIDLETRRDLSFARYSWATGDYILGAAQAVQGLRLGVSGGQEILATLYPEGREFAPLYLWSRTRNPSADRWRTWAGQDFVVADKNVVLARLAAGGEATGHAYLAPPWSRPEPVGAGHVLVARYGETYVALVTGAAGWEVAAAPQRFPAYYAGDPAFKTAWVAAPVEQPADIALEVGRRAEHGDFAAWKRRVAGRRLVVSEGAGELSYTALDGRRLTFLPGERATVDGVAIDARSYPLLAGPWLAPGAPGGWRFDFAGWVLRCSEGRRE